MVSDIDSGQTPLACVVSLGPSLGNLNVRLAVMGCGAAAKTRVRLQFVSSRHILISEFLVVRETPTYATSTRRQIPFPSR